MRYCGWAVPENQLTAAQLSQRAVENTTFYYCGCGWDLEEPTAVTLSE
jgi:hypothetical protein